MCFSDWKQFCSIWSISFVKEMFCFAYSHYITNLEFSSLTLTAHSWILSTDFQPSIPLNQAYGLGLLSFHLFSKIPNIEIKGKIKILSDGKGINKIYNHRVNGRIVWKWPYRNIHSVNVETKSEEVFSLKPIFRWITTLSGVKFTEDWTLLISHNRLAFEEFLVSLGELFK